MNRSTHLAAVALAAIVAAACGGGGSSSSFDEAAAREWVAGQVSGSLVDQGVELLRDNCELNGEAFLILLGKFAQDDPRLIDGTLAACPGKLADGEPSIVGCFEILKAPGTESVLHVLRPAVAACREAGFDPVWGRYGVYSTDEDYETWRKTLD